jgi:hypothetical protein
MEEKTPPEAPEQETTEQTNVPEVSSTHFDWRQYFTTETLFSKWFSIALFIILPFVGFWIGMQIDLGYAVSDEQAPETAPMSNALDEKPAQQNDMAAIEDEPVMELVPWATYVEPEPEPEPEPIEEETATTTEEVAEDEDEEDNEERDLFAPLPDATSTPETGTTTEESA